MALFLPVVGGVSVTTGFGRIWRLLGVNGPNLAHFIQTNWGHFLAFAPQKTRFSASGMGISQGVLLRTGIRSGVNNLPPINKLIGGLSLNVHFEDPVQFAGLSRGRKFAPTTTIIAHN